MFRAGLQTSKRAALKLLLASVSAAAAAPSPDLNGPSEPSQPSEVATPSKANVALEDPLVLVDDPMLLRIEQPAQQLQSWEQGIELVKRRSPSVKSAQAQIDVAKGRERMALAPSLPRLTGTGLLTHQLITPDSQSEDVAQSLFPATVLTGRAELVVPLFSARNWYDYGTSQQVTEKVGLDLAEVERRLIIGLAEALIGVITAERLTEVTRVNLGYALSTFELNRRRVEHGVGNAIDVMRAEQEVERSRAVVIQSDESVRLTREDLARALGDELAWGIGPNIRLEGITQGAKKTCIPGADIERRADVRALTAAERIAERNLSAAELALVPTVNAQTTFVASTNSFATGSRGPVGWAIGGLVTWPLYDGGLRYGEQRQNAGLLQVAKQQLLAAKRNARLEVTQSTRAVEVARRNVEAAQRTLALAEKSERFMRIKFANGMSTSLDMIDSLRTAREARIDVTIKESQLVRAELLALLALATCRL